MKRGLLYEDKFAFVQQPRVSVAYSAIPGRVIWRGERM